MHLKAAVEKTKALVLVLREQFPRLFVEELEATFCLCLVVKVTVVPVATMHRPRLHADL